MFKLHPTLAADTFQLGSLTVCQVLLMNDSRYPWLILVPQLQSDKGEDLRDLHQLPEIESTLVWQEIREVSHALEGIAQPLKLNVAALGNMVPQLHIHIIARNEGDAAWPGPVWGVGEAVSYENVEKTQFIQRLATQLDLN